MHDNAKLFHDLHMTGDTFIMANAWNPGSAVLLEAAGFRAISTASAGVARFSIGGSLARTTFGLVRAAAKEMLERGAFEYACQQIADCELCALFSAREKEQ